MERQPGIGNIESTNPELAPQPGAGYRDDDDAVTDPYTNETIGGVEPGYTDAALGTSDRIPDDAIVDAEVIDDEPDEPTRPDEPDEHDPDACPASVVATGTEAAVGTVTTGKSSITLGGPRAPRDRITIVLEEVHTLGQPDTDQRPEFPVKVPRSDTETQTEPEEEPRAPEQNDTSEDEADRPESSDDGERHEGAIALAGIRGILFNTGNSVPLALPPEQDEEALRQAALGQHFSIPPEETSPRSGKSAASREIGVIGQTIRLPDAGDSDGRDGSDVDGGVGPEAAEETGREQSPGFLDVRRFLRDRIRLIGPALASSARVGEIDESEDNAGSSREERERFTREEMVRAAIIANVVHHNDHGAPGDLARSEYPRVPESDILREELLPEDELSLEAGVDRTQPQSPNRVPTVINTIPVNPDFSWVGALSQTFPEDQPALTGAGPFGDVFPVTVEAANPEVADDDANQELASDDVADESNERPRGY
jgi:hypothetical protein